MNSMTIENAKYMRDIKGNNSMVLATINGQVLYVPLDLNNIHYAEIKKQVDASELTIADAD